MKTLGRLAAYLVAGAATCGALAASAGAETFEVTKKSDPVPGACTANDCSLREAIIAANARAGSDTVVLPSARGSYNLARPDTAEDGALDGDLDINNDPLTLTHPGKGRATIDANEVSRVFDVLTGAPATFRKLVIRDGDQTDANTEGGGIRGSAQLKLIRTSVVSNESAKHGGGIGLINDAGLKMVRSVVSGNVSINDGGGIDGDVGRTVIRRSRITNNESGGEGGGLYFFSEGAPSVIQKSTIAGNRSGQAGGGLIQRGDPESTLRISSSTVSGNTADEAGGGLEVAQTGTVGLVNTTVAGNAAGGTGGGIDNLSGTVRLNATTVAYNRADSDDSGGELGGGLFEDASAQLFEVENSLIASNRVGGGAKGDCAGGEPFASLGHNLLSFAGPADTCEGFDAAGDRVRRNPKIARLARNGGPTKTIALQDGSPAINKAKASTAPARDQRGERRRNPDIGAFER